VFVFKDGECIYWYKDIDHVTYMEKREPDYDLPSALHTMYEDRLFGVVDIETCKTDEGMLLPIAIGWRAGGLGNFIRSRREVTTFYVDDFDGDTLSEKVVNMMRAFFTSLVVYANHGYVFYAHNLGGFDGPLLLQYLVGMPSFKVRPTYRNGIYCIDVKRSHESDVDAPENLGPRGGKSHLLKSNVFSIRLVDSYKLLPSSLKDLGTSFEVETQKGTFPHECVRPTNLGYIGVSPDGTVEEWSLKVNLLKYLESDLDCLYLVIQKYDKLLRGKYSINLLKNLSLPGLSLKLYMTHFMPSDAKIPLLRGRCEEKIRSAYTGGTLNVFKPVLGKGLHYDMVSLYPFAMTKPMPVGRPRHVYNPDLKYFFGFASALVEAPVTLRIPFLQSRHGTKTLNPVGTFQGWYFSEELKYAEKLGYKITLDEGYAFQEGKGVFDEFVNTFFKLKKDASTKAERHAYKLMLNSLYGRFGMRDNPTVTRIVDVSEFKKILNTHHVLNIMDFDEGTLDNKYLVEYVEEADRELASNDHLYLESMVAKDRNGRRVNSSVGISAAITGWARIEMYEHLCKEGVAYTATDSIFTSVPVDPKFVGDKLGQLKLVEEFDRALFVKPNVYMIERNGQYQFKFGGVDRDDVTKEHYEQLYRGSNIQIPFTQIMKRRCGGLVLRSGMKTITAPDDSKRIRVYDAGGAWVDTQPVVLNSLAVREYVTVRLGDASGKDSPSKEDIRVISLNNRIERQRVAIDKFKVQLDAVESSATMDAGDQMRLVRFIRKKIARCERALDKMIWEVGLLKRRSDEKKSAPEDGSVRGPNTSPASSTAPAGAGVSPPATPSESVSTPAEFSSSLSVMPTIEVGGDAVITPPKYRLSGRKILLWFPDTELDHEYVVDKLCEKFGTRTKCITTGRNISGTYIYIQFKSENKFSARSAQYFDFICGKTGIYKTISDVKEVELLFQAQLKDVQSTT
jgi:DNA polymerase type B, organellar and viral